MTIKTIRQSKKQAMHILRSLHDDIDNCNIDKINFASRFYNLEKIIKNNIKEWR